ncbi:MAG: hypothetical protein LUG62_05595 [Clostridiales bacterium]|nr:hypothetical protein [Clostridiales bacterium]
MKGRTMTPREFMKKFTKEEILDLLFNVHEYAFERLARRMCMELYSRKSNKLLNTMEAINGRPAKNGADAMKKHMEWMKANEELDKLTNQYDSIDWGRNG